MSPLHPPLDPPRWDRLAALFHDAVDLPPADRAAFVAERCAGDRALRDELLGMLEAHEQDEALTIERRLLTDDEAPFAPLAPGTRVGPYEVAALVGEGGMGQVYRAERVDGAYRQTVALKVLRPGYLAAEAVRRFRVERHALARLVHPNIAAITDGGALADGRPYLVLRYVDGEPITTYCERRRLALADRLRLFRRVADAVQFAHGRLVVHRDLKPSNILVGADGSPVLLDFGIAKLLDAPADESPFVATRPGLRLLTPGHAAPEQLRGEPAGTAADVYGLGVLLFELLTGRRPFVAEGGSVARLEAAILNEPPPAPSAVLPPERGRPIAGDLDRIVLMALRKEPDRRYATVDQLSDDVGRYLDGRPVRARRDTLAYRARRFLGRNRGAVGAATVAALTAVGLTAASVAQAREAARARDRAERERVAAEDVVAVLTDLFERANPAVVPGGDTVRVASLIADGERRVEAMGADRARQARMWRVLGRLHHARGRYGRADTLLRRSWDAQRRLAGDADPDAARTYHELAVVAYHHEGAEAARPLLTASLARLRQVGDTADVAAALQDLAAAAALPDERRRLLDEAAALLARAPRADSVDVARLLNERGMAREGVGALVEAQALFEAALRILERRLPPEHPDRLAVARNLATTLGGLGRWAEAEARMRAVVAHAPRSIEGDARAGDEERLALLAAHGGRLAEAESGLRASLATLRGAVTPDHWRVDNTLRNLGLVLVARGRVDAGLATLDSAVARARRRGGAASQAHGYLTGQRVLPLLQVGRLGEARAAARESERVLRAALPAGHTRLADLAFWQGAVAMAGGNAAAAERHLRDALAQLERQLPASHPKVAGAGCLLGAALATRGGPRAPDVRLGERCRTYERWGLADPLVVAWGRRALASTAGAAGTRAAAIAVRTR